MATETFFISPGGEAGDAHDTINIGGTSAPDRPVSASEMVEIIDCLCQLDWCTGYELGTERNHDLLDRARDIALRIKGDVPSM